MPVLEMTREQIIAEMERVTRARLGLSAAEAVRAYRTGTLDDPGRVGDVLVLADLLDPCDPFFE